VTQQTDQRPIPFGFAGRVSTEDNQDPEASRNWQFSRARALIEPAGGIIAAEFFDMGSPGRCRGAAVPAPPNCSPRSPARTAVLTRW
jgi:hypothetical protein